jgi:DNA invertase Pin-like site-specific DNA recombinase
MTRKELRLISYVRVSDVRGREGPGFISPNEQREKNEAFSAAMGHTIVREVEELDRSGGDMTRPQFNSVLEQIEAGEADGMIVAKLNRFARSNVGAWQALERIKGAGGELLSVEENIDTSTATGRFLRDFMLIAANWERERIGEQWLSAKRWPPVATPTRRSLSI